MQTSESDYYPCHVNGQTEVGSAGEQPIRDAMMVRQNVIQWVIER